MKKYIPICNYCGKEMINAKDKITNKTSPYLWKCNCKDFPEELILSIG